MTNSHRRSRRLVLIAAVLTALPYGGAALESAAQSKTAGKRNACLLVDREDMERLAKAKVTLLNDIVAEGQTNCEVYREGDSKSPVLILEVNWTGGKELARKEKLAVGEVKRAPGGKTVDIEALTGSASVPRVADEAYYGDAKPSWVLKGDVLLKFSMPGLGADEIQKNFVPLARKALAKLP
jgi:hypothetical protein